MKGLFKTPSYYIEIKFGRNCFPSSINSSESSRERVIQNLKVTLGKLISLEFSSGLSTIHNWNFQRLILSYIKDQQTQTASEDVVLRVFKLWLYKEGNTEENPYPNFGRVVSPVEMFNEMGAHPEEGKLFTSEVKNHITLSRRLPGYAKYLSDEVEFQKSKNPTKWRFIQREHSGN